jgi:hypothetical protein
MDKSLIIGALVGFGLPLIVSIGVALFAKFFPKETTFTKFIAPIAERHAKITEAILGRFLGPVDQQKVEEGIIVTLAYWLDSYIRVFVATLKLNNSGK